MIVIPIELRVARAQAMGQRADHIATQGELTSSIAFVTMAENGMIERRVNSPPPSHSSPWLRTA